MRAQGLVHAVDVALDGLASELGQVLERALGRASQPQRAHGHVGRHRGLAEDLGQAPGHQAALVLHLPQAVLGVDVAEAEPGVLRPRREHVRHAVRVAHDVDRRRQAVHALLARQRGQREAQQRDQAGERGQQEPERDEQRGHGVHTRGAARPDAAAA